jgi:hypothetical protein
MDKAAQRRLSALLWRERLGLALPFLVAAALIVSVAAFLLSDSIESRTTVSGIVDGWLRQQTDLGSSTYLLFVTLAGGSRVVATADSYGRAPGRGEVVTLQRTQTTIGRVNYVWKR